MSKYTTGDYVITAFDARGAKVEQYSLGNMGLIAAQAHGETLIKAGKVHSYAIHRVLHNSLDQSPSGF